MTTSNENVGDAEVSEVDDSNADECRKNESKKKKKKKKKTKRNSGSGSPSRSRHSERHEDNIEDLDENEGHDVSQTSYDSHSHSNHLDVFDGKPPSSRNKKKKKKTESKKKDKKRKKKTEKSEEDDESRHKISLEQAMKRVCNPGMENPAEVVLISGESGIGKSHWIESETKRILLELQQDENDKDDEESDYASDDSHSNFPPVVCRGTCEIPPRIDRGDDDGCGISRPPMHAITEALNNLIRSLTMNDTNYEGGEKDETTTNTNDDYGNMWKNRIEDALGVTEASHLAFTGLVPELGVLLNLPGFRNTSERRKASAYWDWNSPYKFHRSCLAIRDLIRAISECHHPVIMVLRDLHQADKDTYRLLNFLLTGCHWDQKQAAEAEQVDVEERQDLAQMTEAETEAITTTARLNNFLLIGIHEGNSNSENQMLDLLEREQPRSQSYLTKIHMERFRRKKVEDVLRSSILKIKTSDKVKTSDFEERFQEFAEIIYEWTGGVIFYVLQVFEYLKEEGAIVSTPSYKWNIGKVQAQSRRWNNSTIGLTAARIDRLPEVLRSVLINASVFRQTCIEFSSQEIFHLLSAAYADRGRKKKGEIEFPLQSAAELENTLDLACELGFMKRVSWRRSGSEGNFRWAFAHSLIRDEAYSLLVKEKKKMEIHLRLGTKASSLAFIPTSNDQEWNGNSGDICLSNVEQDAFKFLAADQLAVAQELLNKDYNRVALMFVETAEMCISKSAFCAATRYLTLGMKILERNGERFTADNHGLCVQTYLLLARLHSVHIQGANETDEAIQEITENRKNLKDQIMLHQVEIGISIWQKNYQNALEKVLRALELLGEEFLQGGDQAKIISRQIEDLRQETEYRGNQNLLQPVHCTNKKTFDVMALLSNLVEICSLCKNEIYREVATIRMMNTCLISGFTPQYSLSFAHYGSLLMEQSFATNDLSMLKEGYRMGQICEKMARIKSFYGGHSLAIFHHYISHWRRPYRRSLGQILSIYNAQLESGDYFHIQFATFTYVQYHLVSGYSLTKLDDNLQLFDVFCQDYKMENYWKIQFPQRLVANLLGETSDPFLFYGNTIEDQNSRIDQMEKEGETDAVQFMHLLILFNSILFHNHDLSKSCLRKIVKNKAVSIWKPWLIFFQCFTDILSLPNVEKKAERKKLKEAIDKQRDLLLDWYNQGAINCSVMVSLIDAEYLATDTGKKPLPTLRMKKFYDDAIGVACEQELKHMEAFCLERASMRFEAAKSEDLAAEYIAKAHQCYLEWNAIAKVDDIEEKHASKLEIAKQVKKRIGEGYLQQNSDMQYDPERAIGGGRKIKSIDIKKVRKRAEKVTRIALEKSSNLLMSPPGASKKKVFKSPGTPSRRKNLRK